MLRRPSSLIFQKSARELSGVVWAHELATALAQLNARFLDDDSSDMASSDTQRMIFGERLKIALRDVWKDAPADVFDNT